jgi:hypothetical protein
VLVFVGGYVTPPACFFICTTKRYCILPTLPLLFKRGPVKLTNTAHIDSANNDPDKPPQHESDTTGRIRPVGGLIALVAGLVAICVVAIGGFLVNSTTTTALATAAFGVIGSIVGAYFGVKIGTESTQTAIQGQLREAAKSQVYAAHLPAQQADEVLKKAQDIAERTHAKSPG